MYGTAIVIASSITDVEQLNIPVIWDLKEPRTKPPIKSLWQILTTHTHTRNNADNYFTHKNAYKFN